MTIGKKLGACFGAMMAASTLVGVAGWWAFMEIDSRLDEAVSSTARKIELTGELTANVFTFRLQERGLLLFSHIKATSRSLRAWRRMRKR
jgi:hypothetical protein